MNNRYSEHRFVSFGRSAGFTLIELMITVAIIAILVSIAFPSYNNQMVKSRRADAQREVVSYAQSLERWFTTNGTYLNAAGTACGVAYSGATQYYDVASGTVCTATTFAITANPVTSGPQSSDGTLTLNQTGARGGSVNSGNWKY
ncbi:type IV pilin protein [Quatrionicoccus australiensis]|uniref:type IV pilin protein n=1 Tax=Quatrionicoccus australiensis TaxID=138118 RepID=UPI00299E5334|nr:type IV pilin protein [Quatrionicoccus australiensis]UCV16322.1 type IV pilin protein [Quatrionicoccus australiensis]